MKFQLRDYGWPISPFLVPQGTLIDTDVLPAFTQTPWSAFVAASGLPPPINAQPLDQATYDLMRQQFPARLIYTVIGADGINRT